MSQLRRLTQKCIPHDLENSYVHLYMGYPLSCFCDACSPEKLGQMRMSDYIKKLRSEIEFEQKKLEESLKLTSDILNIIEEEGQEQKKMYSEQWEEIVQKQKNYTIFLGKAEASDATQWFEVIRTIGASQIARRDMSKLSRDYSLARQQKHKELYYQYDDIVKRSATNSGSLQEEHQSYS